MGEGVDPTQMCQTLVDKVAQSQQLMAITDPDLLVLFEDWFEELEDLIDTRQEWEFRTGHIKGSVNFSMEPTAWARWSKAGELEEFLGPDREAYPGFLLSWSDLSPQ
jgi:hypothetical protein